MREIIFRGKQIDNGEWVCGDLRHIFNYDKYEPHIVDNSNGRNNNVCGQPIISETLGQYTGLTDKNGRKIFDGDIVDCTFSDDAHKIGFVEWQNEECSYLININYDWVNMDYFACEIIGNIHDNPDLLEVHHD